MKAQESERLKLLASKDAYEKKEIDWNKQSSELRVQVIELGESNVRLTSRSNFFSEIKIFNFFVGETRTIKLGAEK